ncbi:MAG TPA: T9SS type A sorting domain-containing protein, partial [Bacteroidota bacterium]|nr:T9SS type A sorting domain-containing protein [Bacteroidota bacterium]
ILIGDSTEPAVAVSAPNGGEYLIVGTPYNVTWTSSDATGVLRHYIYYSLTGGAPYTLIDSTNGATFTYAWTPGSAAATASIKVTARDSVMNEETDISNSTFVILASNSIAYSAAAGWNLVSVPMLQGVMTPAAILGDDYGAPYFTFQFSPSSGYSIPATLNMGQGYWLGSNTAQAIDAVGTPLSSASLPLVSGFNIIGNPFATDMDVADLSFTDGFDTKNIADAASAGWLSNVLYGYGAGSYFIESTTLDLWNGYWVPMILDGITAEYTPTVGTPTPGTVPVVELGNEPNAWSVELSATFTVGRQAYGDRIAAFGVRPDARTGFDTRYDAPRPPRAPAEDYIELSFAGTDKAFSAAFGDAAYARKFQPVDNDGWEIVVTTSTRGEVALTWDNSSIRELGADLKVELYDPATHTSVDMKSSSSYSFTQEGTERYLMVNRTTTGSAPASYELSQNYPNPFNPTTTIAYGLPGDAAVSIAVFNFLGQKVATLLTGETVQPAGYHEVVFDAATLSSGFYYYRINARGTDGRDFSDLRKMILLK